MKNKGFILLECLIAMIILALTLDLLYQTVYQLPDISDPLLYHKAADFMQDINAIHQLRLILTLGENLEVYDDEIYYQYDNDVMHLCLDDYRLIIKPGTNIVMDHIDYVYFEEDIDDYIYMTYIRGNKQRRVMIRR